MHRGEFNFHTHLVHSYSGYVTVTGNNSLYHYVSASIFSSASMSEVQKEVLTGMQSELAELKSTVSSLKNRLQVTEEQLHHLRKNGNTFLPVLIISVSLYL